MINPLMRMLVSRTALGTPTPAARHRLAANKVHGIRGISIGLPRRFGAVFSPHAVDYAEQALSFCGKCLVALEINHGDNRFAVLLYNHRIFLAGDPPDKLGKSSFCALLI